MKLKPVVIHDYNQHTLGVDKLDQFASYYSFLDKSVKWWMKISSGCSRLPSSTRISSTRSWQYHEDGDQWSTRLFVRHWQITYQCLYVAKHPNKSSKRSTTITEPGVAAASTSLLREGAEMHWLLCLQWQNTRRSKASHTVPLCCLQQQALTLCGTMLQDLLHAKKLSL